MPTIVPIETVFSEFTQKIPTSVSEVARPHLAGPLGELHRYSVAAEKADISCGEYNPDADNTFNYPAKSAGAIVELNSVVVRIDDALLQYYQDVKASGTVVAPVDGYTDRIRSAASSGFKTNGAYTRLTALGDRDVTVGDVVHLVDGTDEQYTTVASLVPEVVDAVVGAVEADSNNQLTRPQSHPQTTPTVSATGGGSSGGSLAAGDYYVRYTFTGEFGETRSSPPSALFTVSSGNIPRVTLPALPDGATGINLYVSAANGTIFSCTLYHSGIAATTYDMSVARPGGAAACPLQGTQIAGTENDVYISAASAASYDGSADGDTEEVYTVEVTTGGAPASARLAITSASGNDDVSDVTPAAYGSNTNIGTRGLTAKFAHTSDNFVVGQTWQIRAAQAWDAPTLTISGDYASRRDVTYIVTVTRGGTVGADPSPQFTVTTDVGSDRSGPTTVLVEGDEYSLGTNGLSVAFAGALLRYGDIFYVPVTGQTDGHYKTIVLTDNLTEALQDSTDMTLTLFLKKNLTVPEYSEEDPDTANWTADADEVVLKDALVATDSTLTDGGDPIYAPVKGGEVFIEYRAWSGDLAGQMYTASTDADVEDAFGMALDDIVPAHHLAYAVKRAVQASNGQPVYFSGVADPDDLENWQEAVDQIEGYKNIANLVPLTRDEAVWDIYRTHVLAQSDSGVGGEWRRAWFNLEARSASPLVTEALSSDGEVVLASLADNPDVADTQYTRLSVSTGNGKFVTNAVAEGDEVRYLFTLDDTGEEIYSTFTVAEVVNEDTLVLESGHTTSVSQPQRVEVWRNMTRTQVAADLISQRDDSLNKRFLYVWPDQFVDSDGLVADGYHLCAVYAGLTGGIAPHQGLRNVALPGVSAMPRSTTFFNNAQLNTLGEAGFVVATVASDGTPYTLYARTSAEDQTAVEDREEATTRLDDTIQYVFWNTAMMYRGNSNLNGQSLSKLRVELQSTIQRCVSDTNIERIGSMIESATITRLAPHATIQDRLVFTASVSRPFPLNDTTLTISF